MSVTLQIGGSLLPPSSVALSGTSETDVYAPTAGPQVVLSIAVCNQDTSNACRVTIRWSDGTNTYHLFTANIEAGETEGVTHGLPLVLNPQATNGDGPTKKITAQAAAGGDLTITTIATRTVAQNSLPGR